MDRVSRDDSSNLLRRNHIQNNTQTSAKTSEDESSLLPVTVSPKTREIQEKSNKSRNAAIALITVFVVCLCLILLVHRDSVQVKQVVLSKSTTARDTIKQSDSPDDTEEVSLLQRVMKADHAFVSQHCSAALSGSNKESQSFRDLVYEHTELEGMLTGDNEDIQRILKEHITTTLPNLSSEQKDLIDVVPDRLSFASECCYACAVERACNVWVFCPPTDAETNTKSWCAGQCWLKHTISPDERLIENEKAIRSGGQKYRKGTSAWTTGILVGKAVYKQKKSDTQSESMPTATRLKLLLRNEPDIGIRPEIIIDLRKDLSPTSIQYISSMVNMKHGDGTDPCIKCEIYRTEKGFLIQGVVRRVPILSDEDDVTDRIEEDSTGVEYKNLRGPPMKRYDVAWAGGFGGPDFFIYTDPKGPYRGGEIVFGHITDLNSRYINERTSRVEVLLFHVSHIYHAY